MKFYRTSLATRIVLTTVNATVAGCGIGLLFKGRWLVSLVLLFVGSIQTFSLWNHYWEIVAEGVLRFKGYGFNLTFPNAELRYAGPVRGHNSFPVSKRKVIEIEISGARAKRYARVADRDAFLQQLQRVAPHAVIIVP
ncbi:hypothetical protein [Granulicella sp. L46]|uniref:hypothetical protein n=1 Tax=Granulicella sp. L46 TaxID=1641865 RepID=UPI00131EC59D|nr:hypothetical protein [Granulicella sp. L46]